MKKDNIVTVSRYRQPIRDYIGRDLDGKMEKVDYVPQSHLRIWHNTQPEIYPLHYHDAVEIIMIMEKPYPVTLGDSEYLLQPGDICFIPSGFLHQLQGGEGRRFIFLIDLGPLSGFSDFHALEPLLMRTWILNERSFPELYSNLESLLDEIIRIYFSGDDMWELSIYARLLKILGLIGKQHLRPKSVSENENRRQSQINYEKFAKLMNYIDTHYAEELTLEWAADYVGFSKYHFHRLFKEYAGITFHDHLINKRIRVAQSLLGTDLSVTEIAFRTGFGNSTSFGRVFRTMTGMSPSDYRKRRNEALAHGLEEYLSV